MGEAMKRATAAGPVRLALVVGCAAAFLGACTGSIERSSGVDPTLDPRTGDPSGTGGAGVPPAILALTAAPRSLASYEYANSIEYLFQDKLLKADTDLYPTGGSLFGASDDGQ